jgi:hypothetical protein
MAVRGVEIWFISGLDAKQIVTKNVLAMFHDCQGDVLCIGIDKGDA